MLRRVSHLVAYDFRSLRRPLVVWGLVLVCESAVLLLGPDRLGADVNVRFSYATAVLVVRFALTAVLAALLVQSDALVGTTAFWRTRPIPRWALLASKLSSAFVLLVASPGLLVLGVLLVLGLPAPDAMRGATAVAGEQAFFLTLAFVGASVTANLAHFVIAGLAGLALVMLGTVILPTLVIALRWLLLGLASWNVVVFSVAAMAGAVATTAHQFLTLRTGRSIALAATALVAATVGAGLWRQMPEAGPSHQVDPSLLTAAAVRVELESTSWERVTRRRGGNREAGWRLATIVNQTGEPDAILLTPDAIDATLLIANRHAARWTDSHASGLINSNTPATERSQPYRSLRAALGEVDLALPRHAQDPKYRVGLIEVGEDIHGRLEEEEGTVDATLTLRAFRYAVTARAPVSPGGRLLMPGFRATIHAVDLPRSVLAIAAPREGVNLTLRDVKVTDTRPFGRWPPSYFVMHNASRRQAVLMTTHTTKEFGATVGLLSRYVTTGSFQLEFDPVLSVATFTVDEEWLRGAELLRLEPEDLGVVTRPLRIEGVKSPGVR